MPLLDVLSTAARPLAAAALCCAFGQAANAQPYPSSTISFVVPYPPGGSPDLVARVIAATLSPKLGQQVAVINRPGGGGQVGIATTINALPDGLHIFGNTQWADNHQRACYKAGGSDTRVHGGRAGRGGRWRRRPDPGGGCDERGAVKQWRAQPCQRHRPRCGGHHPPIGGDDDQPAHALWTWARSTLGLREGACAPRPTGEGL